MNKLINTTESKRGTVTIRYITMVSHRTLHHINISGMIGDALDLRSYISNIQVHRLISPRYNVYYANHKRVVFRPTPTDVSVYIRPVSQLQYRINVSRLHRYHHNATVRRKNSRCTNILIKYICNNSKVLRTVKVRGKVRYAFSILPYTSDDYIKKNIEKPNSAYRLQYNHVGPYPKHFKNGTQVVRIYLSTVKSAKPVAKSNQVINMGLVLIHYRYLGTHYTRTVISRGQIGSPFHIAPYYDYLDTNHGIKVDGVYGLFIPIRINGHVAQYSSSPQEITIYAKEQSMEVDMLLPVMIIDSLEHYIHYGSWPYFKNSKGPVDITRSNLTRYLMTAHETHPNMLAYHIMSIGRKGKQKYVTFKTTNAHIILSKSIRPYLLVGAMIDDKIPIMSFYHRKDGGVRYKNHMPAVKQVYFPEQYAGQLSDE